VRSILEATPWNLYESDLSLEDELDAIERFASEIIVSITDKA
jgi:hypothetical protein